MSGAETNGDGRLVKSRDSCSLAATGLLCASGLNAATFASDVAFGEPIVLPAGANCTSVIAADLDGDGDLDLAASARESSTVTVYLNNGDMQFSALLPISVAITPRYVIAADLDGDGDEDLVTACDSFATTVLWNNGNAVFSRSDELFDRQAWVGATDLSSDGDLDLVYVLRTVPSQLLVRTNDGAGNFTDAAPIEIGTEARAVAFGFFDADPNVDLAVVNLLSNSMQRFHSTPMGTLLEQPIFGLFSQPRDIQSGDFDQDGTTDLAIAMKGTDLLWLVFGNGSGGFTAFPKDRYALHATPHSVDRGDVDGDGDLDLICGHVANDDGYWFDVLINDGSGVFTTLSQPTANAIADAIFADLNGDGRPELIGASTNGDAIILHEQLVAPTCIGDLDQNRSVDFNDLLTLLCAMAAGESTPSCPGDVDGNGDVNFQDLVALLAAWGPC